MSRAGPGGRRALDAYYTPDGLARTIVQREAAALAGRPVRTILEPSAGGGAFVRALREVAPRTRIVGVDLNPDAAGLALADRAIVADFVDVTERADLVIGNPPYRQAEEHIRHALTLAPVVVMLLRLGMLESRRRIPLWREHPAAHVTVLSERPSFTGRGTDSAAYGVFRWDAAHTGPTTLDVWSWRP